MGKDITQLTLRIANESLRALKFVSADQDVSVNKLVNDFILQGLRQCRVSVPIELLHLEEK
jgi:predicted HicB family RNase H-like nuclease